MNKFNQLYNLILQSIILEDIQSKTRKAIQTLIKSGQLQSENDPRVEQVKAVIERSNSIDINSKTKLDQLLKTNQKYTLRNIKKQNIDIIKYIDQNVPQFSQKKIYKNGVIIYRVDDTKEGQAAVRKIVDINLGDNWNPWCLIKRNKKGNLASAWHHWKDCSGYPKHIAFQNGNLIAFCASGLKDNLWWDLQNQDTFDLVLPDGTTMKTEKYKWFKGK